MREVQVHNVVRTSSTYYYYDKTSTVIIFSRFPLFELPIHYSKPKQN